MVLYKIYKTARENGLTRTESAIWAGSTGVGAIAPAVYVASKADWANHPYWSAVSVGLSLVPVGVVTGIAGFVVGANIAAGLMFRRKCTSKNKPQGLESRVQSVERGDKGE